MIADSTNRSAQISYGVTLPAYRELGLGTRLAQECLRIGCRSSQWDLFYGFPRNATMYQILSSVTQPRMQFTGDDGAINVANGQREYHAVIFARNPRAFFRHVLPSGNSLAASRFVRSVVLARFGSATISGDYPHMHIAGFAQPAHHRDGIRYRYDPACPSGAMEILSCSSGDVSSQGVHDTIMQFLDKFPGIQHTRMAVLADKLDFIAELLASGFRIAAYLPAWLYHEAARFDCVLMVRGAFSEKPVIHGMEDLMQRFQGGYADAAEECRVVRRAKALGPFQACVTGDFALP
jgi:hypothetical protein